MRNIRIGKDIKCRWAVRVNDGSVPLTSLTYILEVCDQYGNKTVVPHTIENNAIVFSLSRNIQKIGKYTATIYTELEGKQTVLDACNFVRIVSNTCDETEPTSDNITIETVDISGDMLIGVQGDSAYQTWLNAGNEGTEEDFLEWLRTPINDAIPTYTDLGEIND